MPKNLQHSNVVKLRQRIKLLDLRPQHRYEDADGAPFVYMGLSRYHKEVGHFEGAADYDHVGVVPVRETSGPFYEVED